MRFVFLFVILFTGLITVAQKKYKPTIVVLDPHQTNFDTSLLVKIQEFTYSVDISAEEEKHILDSLGKKEKNIRIIDIAEYHFRKHMDFASSFTLGLYGMLTYMVFGQTEDCIVIVSHDKSNGAIGNLKTIAQKYEVEWVVNPILFQSYTKDGEKFSKARIQVYNFRKNRIILDKEYIGDTRNPGFELSCESGSLDCTISNIIDPSLHDILLTILKSYQH